MKTEKFDGTVASAYGETLTKPVSFSGSFDAYETVDEIRAANDWPSDDDVIGFVNAKRKAAKRAAATTEALQAAGIEKPDPNTPENRRKRMIADFVAMKVPVEIATQQVDAILRAATAGV